MKYRADIDGIRAIAVTVVILFHYGVPGFAGGFVGVDIFFVLSGYLISSIIFAQTEQGRFEFGTFYFRRIRRLFPVYLVVMLVTFALAYGYMLPQDFREFGQSLLASTVYLSNVLFYMEAGYFDTSSHLKPLLHTWSLSVEEQFYVVFPFLAWLCGHFSRKALFVVFAVLTAISLSAAAAYIEQDNSAVFYLYPFRAWEMFFGTLLATNFIPQIRSRMGNNALAIAGLAMVLGTTFFYDEHTVFPGLSAILPCLGTVLLIYTGASHQGWIHQLLSARGMVFTGNISYSLYLWHWPVYVLYLYNKPAGITWFDTTLMACVTVVLSVLSWKYVETPFRHGRVKFSDSHRGVFISTAAFSLVFVLAGFYVHKTNGMPQRLDQRTATFALAAGDLFGDLSGCEQEDNERLPHIAYCTIGDPFNAESYTLLWGDSHGGAYKRGFTAAMEGREQHALIAWTGGCPPVYGLTKDETASSKAIDDRCWVRNNAVQELLKRDRDRIDAVVLVGRWSYYLNGAGVGVDDHNKIWIWPHGQEKNAVTDAAEYFNSAIYDTIKELHSQGFPVFAVEQPPEFSKFRARVLAIGLMNGSSDFDQSIQALGVESYADVLARQGQIQETLNAAEAEGIATVLRTHHFFCDNAQCSLMLNGAPSYFDNNHVSSSGAVQIKAMFAPVVDHVTSNQR